MTDRGTVQIVTCVAGPHTFGLDMNQIVSVHRGAVLKRRAAPACGIDQGEGESVEFGSDDVRAVDSCVGHLDIGTECVPVDCLAQLIGSVPSESIREQNVVVFRAPNGHRGLLVDNVSRVLTIGQQCIWPLPPIVFETAQVYFDRVLHLAAWQETTADQRIGWQLARRSLEEHVSLKASGMVLQWAPARWLRGAVGVSPPRSPYPILRPLAASRQSVARQILVFRSTEMRWGERAYSIALSITQLAEITEAQTLLPIPNSHPSVCGLVDWRGRPVPVFDFAHLLSRDDSAGVGSWPQGNRIVIARSKSGEAFAFFADAQVRVLKLPLAARHVTLEGLPAGYISASFATEVGTVLFPDLDRILQGAAACPDLLAG